MKIKRDENMPRRLSDILSGFGHETETVPQEGLKGHADPDIWAVCQHEGRFLITQDLDFSDVRQYKPGTHHGLLLVRLPEPGREALVQAVTSLFATEDVENWTGCLVVATHTKIRIRHAEP